MALCRHAKHAHAHAIGLVLPLLAALNVHVGHEEDEVVARRVGLSR
jgi:hypothetical protein